MVPSGHDHKFEWIPDKPDQSELFIKTFYLKNFIDHTNLQIKTVKSP